MTIPIKIRGIPSFSFAKDVEVKDVDALWELFIVRVTNKPLVTPNSMHLRTTGQRVMVYIPVYYADAVKQCCAARDTSRNLYAAFNGTRLASAGTAPNEWIYVEPHNHPGYAEALEKMKRERAARIRDDEIAQAHLESLHRRLDDLVEEFGIHQILQRLENQS